MNLKIYIKNIALLLAVMLLISCHVFALAPEPPLDITFDCQTDCTLGLLKWRPNPNGSSADNFKLYIAKGQTMDLSKFKIYWKSESSDSLINYEHGFLGANIFINPGEYSLYMTSVNDDGESANSKIIFKKIVSNEIRITFSSTPDTVAFVGEKYIYKTIAVASNNGPVNYSLISSPVGMIINAMTGDLHWLPSESRKINIVIKAYLKYNPSIANFQSFSIHVKKCRRSSGIYGTIKDDNNNYIPKGSIEVYRKNTSSDSTSITLVNSLVFENGIFHLNLDEGIYFLHFVGDIFESKWYTNAYEIKDATPIEVKCGDSVLINAKVNLIKKDKTFKISGMVNRASNQAPLQHVLIFFYGLNNVTTEINIFNTITNSEGKYNIDLSDKFSYIALARSLDSMNGQNIILLPQFYNGAEEPAGATKIILTDNRDDINFSLLEQTKIGNKISGILKNDSNKTLKLATVVAYPVNYKGKIDFNNIRSTQTNDNGLYSFDNLNPGDYLLLAFTLDKSYIPSYYKETVNYTRNWKEATRIKVTATTVSDKYTIKLIPRASLNTLAKGKISGRINKTISIANNKDMPQSDEPVAGAVILLEDMMYRIINFTISDKNGDYSIPYLLKGRYRIFVDKIGFNDYSEIVNVLNDESDISKHFLLIDDGATDVQFPDFNNYSGILVFPNPAKDNVSLLNLQVEQSDKIDIFDASGKIIYSENISTPTNLLSLDCSMYKDGAYFLRLIGKNKSAVIPFIIIK